MKTMERLPLPFLRPQVRHTLDPNQFVYQEKAGVDNSILYLLHRPYSHLEKRNSAVRIMCFLLFQCHLHHPTAPPMERQADRDKSDLDHGLPHRETTICQTWWLLLIVLNFVFSSLGSSVKKRDAQWLTRLVRRAGSVDGKELCSLTSETADCCLSPGLHLAVWLQGCQSVTMLCYPNVLVFTVLFLFFLLYSYILVCIWVHVMSCKCHTSYWKPKYPSGSIKRPSVVSLRVDTFGFIRAGLEKSWLWDFSFHPNTAEMKEN